jgi:hypothetical protein
MYLFLRSNFKLHHLMATKKSTAQASEPAATEKKPKAAASPKSPAAPKRLKKATPEKEMPVISYAAIAQRAYFLSEDRCRSNKSGNPTQDWLDAEKQLTAELMPKRANGKRSK